MSDVDRRIALERELDEVVGRIREMEDFEHFMLPPPFETLLPAAEGGPVCIVNVSQWRCDALIVTTDGVQVVELPDLTPDEAAERARAYLGGVAMAGRAAALVDATAGADGSADGGADAEPQRGEVVDVGDVLVSSEGALSEILVWLWDVVAAPVLDAPRLGEPPAEGTASEVLPRLWWCPTGPLSLLPLHAAGRHGPDDVGRAVLDRVVSSYTPTLRALLEARRRTGAGASGDDGAGSDLLVVSLPNVEGEMPLPHVTGERNAMVGLPGLRAEELDGPKATRERVAEALGRHRYVHLCCHGRQDLDDPSSGGLLLHDGVLTIAEIGGRRHDGELAFLSACKTATGGLRLPDEAITLASALHYTGFRHVVATLWSVYDLDAATVAVDVDERITAGGRIDADGAALALHDAVQSLRSRHRTRPSVWTPFVHVGP